MLQKLEQLLKKAVKLPTSDNTTFYHDFGFILLFSLPFSTFDALVFTKSHITLSSTTIKVLL